MKNRSSEFSYPRPGTRVALHPSLTLWMMGVRFADVHRRGRRKRWLDSVTGDFYWADALVVRLDSGRLATLHPDNVSEALV